LGKTGIILGATRTHASSQPGTKVSEVKPFYRSALIDNYGAITINKVLTLITMNDSMNGAAFVVFIIYEFLSPQL
jgi:putative transposase